MGFFRSSVPFFSYLTIIDSVLRSTCSMDLIWKSIGYTLKQPVGYQCLQFWLFF